MSTVPGPEAWRDAGLAPVEPEEPRRIGDEDAPDENPDDPEDYSPEFARADREDRANEADVVEQDIEVPIDEDVDEEQ